MPTINHIEGLKIIVVIKQQQQQQTKKSLLFFLYFKTQSCWKDQIILKLVRQWNTPTKDQIKISIHLF